MNPLEFDLVWIFHDKLCFKESNQTLSRVLLRIGFFTSEKNEQGFSRRWYTSMYSFSSVSWLISHFSLSNLISPWKTRVPCLQNPIRLPALWSFFLFHFWKTRNSPPLPANYSLSRQLLLHTVPNFQVFSNTCSSFAITSPAIFSQFSQSIFHIQLTMIVNTSSDSDNSESVWLSFCHLRKDYHRWKMLKNVSSIFVEQFRPSNVARNGVKPHTSTPTSCPTQSLQVVAVVWCSCCSCCN